MNKYQIIGTVLGAGVLGYFVGVNFPFDMLRTSPFGKQTADMTSPFASQRFAGRNGQTNGNGTRGTTTTGNMTQRTGGMMGARPASGEILSIDDKSMTVKLPNNTSKIVIFESGMIINKIATATATDLKVGEKVAAFGKENTDGSMTAQNVQLNPQFQMSGRVGGNLPSGAPISK